MTKLVSPPPQSERPRPFGRGLWCLRRLGLGLMVLASPLALPALRAGAQPAPTSTGGIGIQLVPAPGPVPADPRSRIYIVDHLPPGASLQRWVQISNTTPSPVQVSVYVGAATISGGSFLGSAAGVANELSSWTSVSPGAFLLPAGETARASVTVAIPRDASPGERYAVVWAQARSHPDSHGLVQVNRVGIRLYISTGPGGPPASDLAVRSLTAKRTSTGDPEVVASVSNTGGLALDLSGTLNLSAGPGGLNAGPYPATLAVTLGVGQTEPLTIVLDHRLPAGPWTALVTVRSGLLERSAHAVITFPRLGSGPPVAASGSSGQSPLLDVLLGVVLALVLAGLAWMVRRRLKAKGPRTHG